jgi:hypothetical protein
MRRLAAVPAVAEAGLPGYDVACRYRGSVRDQAGIKTE